MTLRNAFDALGLDSTLQAIRARLPVLTAGGRMPVDIAGANIQGTFTTQPSVQSVGNIPPGPLAANELYVGQWEDVLDFAAVQVSIFTDAASTTNGASIEFSTDGVSILRAVPTTIPANFAAYFHLAPEARFVRFRYQNGPVAQTVLRLSLQYAYQPPAEVIQPLGSQITDANIATIVKSHLTARVFSGSSAGAWVPLGTDGAGGLLTSDRRTLSERMFARAPATGYSLWLDTADPLYIYIAEAPTAADGTATTFRGIRVQKDATGNPLGKVQTLDGFTWNSRAAGAWV